jgi:hypothetical protein
MGEPFSFLRLIGSYNVNNSFQETGVFFKISRMKTKIKISSN